MTLRTAARQASLSFTISLSLLKHVHWVRDAIQTSYPLSPSSLPALHLSQHQGFFLLVGSSHQVAKELELQLQHQSSQWIIIIYYSKLWIVIVAYSYWVLTSSKVLTHLKHIIQSSANARDTGSIPGSGRFPRRKAEQHTPVFLPGKSHGQRGLVGSIYGVAKQSDTT